MPRRPRISAGGIAYHVMNRTSGRLQLFDDAGDYEAFERVLTDAVGRYPQIRLCAYCLMPNHFHLVLWPERAAILSRFMQWLAQTHAARWHAHRHSRGRGHLYQSRFKSFPIQQDAHFLKVCRYVERNALRANLVESAEAWQWSSLWTRLHGRPAAREALSPWPVAMPRGWTELVNRPQDEKELAAIRRSRDRGQPYGDHPWTSATAISMGLESTLRPVGRPSARNNNQR